MKQVSERSISDLSTDGKKDLLKKAATVLSEATEGTQRLMPKRNNNGEKPARNRKVRVLVLVLPLPSRGTTK